MQHAASKSMPRPAAASLTPTTIVLGLLSGGVVAALVIAWRLGLTAGEAVLAGSQMVLFLLNSWLLSRSSTHTGIMSRLINVLGLAFMAIRCTRFTRAAFILPEAPEEYAPIFADTPFAYAIYAFYIAESLLTQVVLHRMLPGWACVPLAALQAQLFSQCNFRFIKPEHITMWRVARIILTHQVGMFAPYHLLSQQWVRRSLGAPAVTVGHKAHTRQLSSGGKDSKQAGKQAANSSSEAGAQRHGGSNGAAGGLAAAVLSQSCMPGADGALAGGEAAGKLPAASGGAAQRQGLGNGAVKGSMVSPLDVDAAVAAIANAPYRSRLRVMHKVCIKLDTNVTCDRLPPTMARSLEDALRVGIGQATSLSITDVAVRPGCIAITLTVAELLAAAPASSSTTAGAGAAAPTGCVDACAGTETLAHALLPQLQALLSKEAQGGVPFQRALVQLDDWQVRCVWHAGRNEWSMHVCGPCPSPSSTHAAEQPPRGGRCQTRLGIAQALALQPCATADLAGREDVGGSQTGECPLLEVVAEVQLWGVTKLIEIEGWAPPAEHVVSDVDWASVQPAAGGPLRVLARVGATYLPTQVVRLLPGPSAGRATAQVRVQLRHQQMLHHAGAPPSTLLLMGLELWHHEALLSSSPVLTVPSSPSVLPTPPSGALPAPLFSASPTACSAAAAGPAPIAWWWGASGSCVAAAMAEIQQCTQLLAAAEPADAESVQANYVVFLEDLAAWLVQVQRLACSSGLCRCGPAATAAAGAAAPTAALQQPRLDPSELCQLCQELRDYAQHLGWKEVPRMLSQQLRAVVKPAAAAAAAAEHAGALWPAGAGSWLEDALRATRTALLGYRCPLDEQLYKQQLCVHLSGVLLLSSSAASVIGVAVGSKAAGWLAAATFSWTFLHVMAVAGLLSGRQHKQQGLYNSGLRRAFVFITLATLYRIVAHVMWGVLLAPDPESAYTQARSQPAFMIAVQLAMAMMEQVPASVMMPTWASTLALLTEFLVSLVDGLRLLSWQPAASCTAALLVVVGAHVVLDAHLRKQLAPCPPAPAATCQQVRTCSVSKPG